MKKKSEVGGKKTIHQKENVRIIMRSEAGLVSKGSGDGRKRPGNIIGRLMVKSVHTDPEKGKTSTVRRLVTFGPRLRFTTEFKKLG